MTTAQHYIELVMGDTSGDGHGRTDSTGFMVNMTATEIRKAYQAGTKLLGFDLTKEVGAEYGRGAQVSDEILAVLRERNCPFIYEDEDRVYRDSYPELYLWIAQLAEPTLTWEQNNRRVPQIEIGGYAYF